MPVDSGQATGRTREGPASSTVTRHRRIEASSQASHVRWRAERSRALSGRPAPRYSHARLSSGTSAIEQNSPHAEPILAFCV